MFSSVPFVDGIVCNDNIDNFFDLDIGPSEAKKTYSNKEINRINAADNHQEPIYYSKSRGQNNSVTPRMSSVLNKWINFVKQSNWTYKLISDASPRYESEVSLTKFKFKKIKSVLFLKKLRRRYENICSCDIKHPYIYFALHYQPELTTMPLADLYRHQYLAISQLSNRIPDGWHIIVKEHPSQFRFDRYGEQSRPIYYYDLLSKIKKVKLAPIDKDSFNLIDGSIATASVGGTVGFESILREKPTFVWYKTWYSHLTGCILFKNTPDLINLDYFHSSQFDDLVFKNTTRELATTRDMITPKDNGSKNKYIFAYNNYASKL